MVKTASAAYIEMRGRRVPMVAVLSDEAETARQRGGAVHDRLRDRLRQATPDARIPVAVKFVRRPTRAGTDQEADELTSELLESGFDITGRGKVAALIFAKGDREAIERVARSSRVEAVYLDEPVSVVQTSPDEPLQYTEAATAMFPLDLTGATQVIGLVERVPDNGAGQVVRAYSENELFQGGLDNTHDPVACNTTAQCEALWSTTPPAGQAYSACRDQLCVANHATGVAGVMAQVAPGARLFMGNAPGLDPISSAGLDEAFDSLLSAGVSIVNESFQAQFSGVQGVVEDDLARQGIFVTVAAGNSAGEAGTISWACRDSQNALCVGSHGYGLQLSCFSSWENPGVPSGPSDREEPDILAFGGDGSASLGACSGVSAQSVLTAGTASTTDTAHFRGTSMAAPAAAASAALVRECFESVGQQASDLALRAVLMGSALRNSLDYRYSTPFGTDIGGTTDWRDGAGVLGLSAATFKCDPKPGPWVDGGDKTIDLTSGEPVPWDSEEPLPDSPPECPPGGCSGLMAQNIPPGPGDGRLM